LNKATDPFKLETVIRVIQSVCKKSM